MMHERQRALQRLSAYVDGELALADALELETRFEQDAALRAQAEALRQLRSAVRERASYHAAPAALRARVAKSQGLDVPATSMTTASPVSPVLDVPSTPGTPTLPPMPSTPQTPQTPQTPPVPSAPAAGIPSRMARPARDWLRRWFAWRPMALALGIAALLVWALDLAPLPSSGDERIAEQAIASQVRASLGQHLVDVASSEQHTVKPWLSARLDYSPPVHELSLPGVAFLGGRIDYLDGRPVAALVYRDGKHLVNAFVWPSAGRESSIRTMMQRGYHVAHWAGGGMATWVVSDMNPAAFESFVHALAAADAAR